MSDARVFIDTNVVAYALDASSPQKRAAAQDLIARLGPEGRLVFSTQVFQETYAVLVRKMKVAPAQAERAVTKLFDYAYVATDTKLLSRAMHRHQDDSIAFYNALIVEAALAAECALLASEDFQQGRRFGKLRVVNPFNENIE